MQLNLLLFFEIVAGAVLAGGCYCLICIQNPGSSGGMLRPLSKTMKASPAMTARHSTQMM
jgi:hypothetical protein